MGQLIRARDWLAQAKRDLDHAKRSKELQDHEWACFASQQAAEKALKALLNQIGIEARGHSVLELLDEASRRIGVPDEFFEAARILDKHYIPSRYPNAYASGAPFQYYSDSDAKEAIAAASRLVEFASGFVEGGSP